MASQFNQLARVSPNPVTRTASAPIAKSEPIYDDVCEVMQRVPPPVAARPKSPNMEQRNILIYGNVEENTIRRQPPPVAPKWISRTPPTERRNTTAKSERHMSPFTERGNTLPAASNQNQQMSPVTERKNTSYNNTDSVAPLSNEITTKLQSLRPPPPVANKPKQQMSPVTERRNTLPAAANQNQQMSPVTERKNTSYNNTNNVPALANEFATKLQSLSPPSPVANRPMSPVTEQRNSPLYNNTASTVTEPIQRAPSPVVTKLAQQASPWPVTNQRNSPLHDDSASTQPIMEGDRLYGNTPAVLSRQAVPSPIQKFVPDCEQLTPPITKQSSNDLYVTDLHEHGETEVSHPVHPHPWPYDYEYVDCTPNSPIMHERISHGNALEMIQPTQGFSSMLRQPQTTDRETNNRAYLQSLSRSDVLQLLDNMNLSQHKASFQEEQVDGTVLAVLTSDDLKELGVTKRVQIIRLLQLIEGTTSAKVILETNSYY